MTFARSETFRSIGHILAADVLPALYRSQKLPLRISCLGVASYDASDAANGFDRVIPLGECPSPEEAIQAASLRLSRGDICTGPDSFPYFQPRIMLIQDRDQRLVLAGEIRAAEWMTSAQARTAGSEMPSVAVAITPPKKTLRVAAIICGINA